MMIHVQDADADFTGGLEVQQKTTQFKINHLTIQRLIITVLKNSRWALWF